MPIHELATVVVAGDLLATEFGDELVILNLRDGVYYGLEDIGVRIWKLLQRPTTIAAICEMVVSEYDVDASRCKRDIRSLIQELASKGLLEVRDQV